MMENTGLNFLIYAAVIVPALSGIFIYLTKYYVQKTIDHKFQVLSSTEIESLKHQFQIQIEDIKTKLSIDSHEIINQKNMDRDFLSRIRISNIECFEIFDSTFGLCASNLVAFCRNYDFYQKNNMVVTRKKEMLNEISQANIDTNRKLQYVRPDIKVMVAHLYKDMIDCIIAENPLGISDSIVDKYAECASEFREFIYGYLGGSARNRIYTDIIHNIKN